VFPQDLRDRHCEMNKHFSQNVRVYNNLFALVSFNAANINSSGCISTLKIIGQVKVKATQTLESQNPKFGLIDVS